MKYLLDTCFLSDLRIGKHPQLNNWLIAIKEENTFISAISIGEIVRGINRLPQSKIRLQLQKWLDNMLASLQQEAFLPVDLETAQLWGKITAKRDLEGLPLSPSDGLIAATAIHYNLTLVTRNEKDFKKLGVKVVNPW